MGKTNGARNGRQTTPPASGVPEGAPFQRDPRNARRHDARNKALVRASLAEVGAFRSIAVDGDGIVRAGNATYEEALALGYAIKQVEAAPDELVAVVRRDLKGRKAERAALLDNRAQELSSWDAAYMQSLGVSDPELLEGMFTDDEKLEFEALAWSQDEASKPYGSMRDAERRAKFVEVVVAVEQHETIERALAKAHERLGGNRGDALVHICEAYLAL